MEYLGSQLNIYITKHYVWMAIGFLDCLYIYKYLGSPIKSQGTYNVEN